jgi:sRNA-binding regulator protein Hfq
MGTLKTQVVTFIFIAVLLSGMTLKSRAQKKIPEQFCISFDEQLLFDKINLIRDDYGKPELDFSISLSYLAEVHVEDLLLNNPDTSICNLSSWSDKGEWTPCCYNSYVVNQDCMWDKPKEITNFTYRGYELAAYFEDGFNVDSVINLWSGSKPVLDMILTEGNFKKKKWICMGVAFNDHYVSVWFAQRADRFGEPDLCSESDTTLLENAASDSITAEVTYYLVFGSFSQIKDAREAVKRYTKNGFENAGTIKSDDKYRVYLNKFSSLKEAMFAKQQLPYIYREAWVYKE